MGENTHYLETMSLVGGALCLDFTNTLSGRKTELREHVERYEDLVVWSRHAGAVTDDEARRLLAAAAARPAEAALVHTRAIALREAIYGIFVALTGGADAPPAALAALNAELARALPHLHVAPAGAGFDWIWGGAPAALDRPLWPLARSAADLLTGEHLDRVHQCGGDGCAWLFVDLSRNHSRRWCNMNDCGNRAKARRHYHRQRPATA
jgi:predicted RNA-binding Zn ribbon-like protein